MPEMPEMPEMDDELKSLRIDRSRKRSDKSSPRAVRWILVGVTVLLGLGATSFLYGRLNQVPEVETVRVRAASPVSGQTSGGEGGIILNATGYIVAAHKI